MLKAGFARVDITPPFGVSVQGYFEPRTAKGVLDPLLATAVAFDDGRDGFENLVGVETGDDGNRRPVENKGGEEGEG